ncbi:MAG: hypothetical protein DRI61_00470 [Chloroflexi bacterium]|nr:MAG: hypothetical protein DRI61_00470 [Chloroflexota bacterium]
MGTLYPISRVGSNSLWANAGPFFGLITELGGQFQLPVCPQRDTLTRALGEVFLWATASPLLFFDQLFAKSENCDIIWNAWDTSAFKGRDANSR